MREEYREDLKKALIAVLKRHEVKKAALFGSFARDEATEESDIELVVEFEGRKSLLDLQDYNWISRMQLKGRWTCSHTIHSIHASKTGSCVNR